MTDDSLLHRVRDRYRDATTPEHVERASRRERWKRAGWEFCALIVALGIHWAAIYGALLVGQDPLTGVVVVGLFSTYAMVWSLGINVFNITAPWHFREAELEEEREAA